MALFLVVACNTEPDECCEFQGHITLDPTIVFLQPGETRPVLARYIADPEGFSAPMDFSVVMSAGIVARFDSTFRPVYRSDGSLGPFPNSTEQRILITMSNDVPYGTVTVRGAELARQLTVYRRP